MINRIPAVILDVDLRQQTGIIQALGGKKIPITAVSSFSNCPAFHSKFVSRSIISPDLNDEPESYIDFLCNIHEKGVLIYSGDANTMVISKYQDILKNAGFLLNIPKYEQLKFAFDKWLCCQLLNQFNVPMAKTALVTKLSDVYDLWDTFSKPVILKGTRMAGGNYQKIYNRQGILPAYDKLHELINSDDYRSCNSGLVMQEWMTYAMTDMWSCETVYNQQSQPEGFFTIRRIRSSLNEYGSYTSRLFAGEYEESKELIEATKKILSGIKWKGFAHVEYFFVPKEQKFFLTEINPRLPGYSYYPSKAGFNLAYYYYADLAGIKHDAMKSYSKSLYFESFRCPGDITQGVYHILKGHLGLSSFVCSYLRIFSFPGKVIIDPLRLDDVSFTLFSLFEEMKFFIRKVYFFLKKRLFARASS